MRNSGKRQIKDKGITKDSLGVLWEVKKMKKNFGGDQHRASSNFVPNLLLNFMQLTQFNLTNFPYLSIFVHLSKFVR